MTINLRHTIYTIHITYDVLLDWKWVNIETEKIFLKQKIKKNKKKESCEGLSMTFL